MPSSLPHWSKPPPSRTWTIVMTYQQDYLSPCLYLLSALCKSDHVTTSLISFKAFSLHWGPVWTMPSESHRWGLLSNLSSLLPSRSTLCPPGCSPSGPDVFPLGLFILWFLIAGKLAPVLLLSAPLIPSSSVQILSRSLPNSLWKMVTLFPIP